MTGMTDIVLGGGVPWWLAAGLALAATGFLAHQFRFLRRSLGLGKGSLLTLLRGDWSIRAPAAVSAWAPCAPWRTPTSLRRPLGGAAGYLGEHEASPPAPAAPAGSIPPGKLSRPRGLTRALAGKYDLKLYSFDRETDSAGTSTPLADGEFRRAMPAGCSTLSCAGGPKKRAGRRRGRRGVGRHRQPGRTHSTISQGHPQPGLRGRRWGEAEGFKDLRIAGLRTARAGLSRPRRHHRLHDSGVRPGRCPGAALLQPRPQPHLHAPHRHRPGHLREPRHPQLHAAGARRPRLHPDAARAGRRKHRRKQPQGVPDGGAPGQDPGVDPFGFALRGTTGSCASP